MSKQSRMVMVIAVGLVLPRVNHAESYGGGYDTATSAMQNLSSLLSTSSSSSSPTSDKDKAKFQQIEKNLSDSKQEYANRKRNADLRKKNDQLGNEITFIDLAKGQKYNQDAQNNQNALQLVPSLSQAPQGVDTSATDTGDLEKTCSSGVDFTQFNALTNQLGSQPFQQMRDQVTQLLQAKDDKIQAQKRASIQALLKHLKETQQSKNDPTVTQEQDQTHTSVIDNPYELQNRLKGQQQYYAQVQGSIADRQNELFQKIFGDAANAGASKDKAKFAQARNSAMDSFEALRRQVVDAFHRSANKLKKNCEDMVDDLGRDNPQSGLMNGFYQWSLRLAQPKGEAYVNSVMPPIDSDNANLASNLSQGCPDVTSDFDNLLAPLQQAENTVRNDTDPTQAMTDAANLITNLGNAEMQVGSMVKDLKDRCNFVAKEDKKAIQKIKGLQGQYAQSQGYSAQGSAGAPQAASAPHSQATNRAVGSH